MRAVKHLNIYRSRAAVSPPLFLPPPVPLLPDTATKQNSTSTPQLPPIPSIHTSAYTPPVALPTCCSASCRDTWYRRRFCPPPSHRPLSVRTPSRCLSFFLSSRSRVPRVLGWCRVSCLS